VEDTATGEAGLPGGVRRPLPRPALEYTYELTELVPGERLVMRTAQGPFPMETTYTWSPGGPASTRMTLRNRGEPSGFSRLVAPFVAPMMRRANRNDLAAIKALLEERHATGR